MSDVKAVALAGNALTTLQDMVEMIGLDDDLRAFEELPEDEKPLCNKQVIENNVTRLINASSQWIETIVGRKLGKQKHTERHTGSGQQELTLNQWPILDVEYIKDLSNGQDYPREGYDWLMGGNIGVLHKETGWRLRGYPHGLAGDFSALRRYLEVSYIAGYVLPKDATDAEPATLPADLQQIVWGIGQQEYSIMRNGAQGLAAFSISDVTWTFDKEPRTSWLETIGRYQRW